MNTTIGYLEEGIKKNRKKNNAKSFLKELKIFIIMFVISFVGMLLFTNAELFFGGNKNGGTMNWKRTNIQTNGDINTDNLDSSEIQGQLDLLLDKYANEKIVEKETSLTIQEDLQDELVNYNFDFNMLPPTNRIIIEKIGIDAPLVDSKYKDEVDFTQGNFSEELENGVVKYPTTPEPGYEGNTLLFGHTSQERRQKNPYGTVFSKMPNLEKGDKISVVWGGKLYEYEIVEKTIVTPAKVNEQYKKYQIEGKDYLTIMGCYPIGRTDKRMMITAVRVG